ncbi:hypothetical protein GW17_00043488 [Ensete ventricosum]|nr:hypothetical protein GW17_00043488 [Ensete ventricosum]
MFPNSGIRAKVFMRKIGFKLRVMRLNRVESFNAFATRTARRRGWPWLAVRGSRLRPRPPARGWLAMANPPAGVAGCSQGPPARWLPTTCKGRPPAGAVGCQRCACKRLPTVHPQGAARGAPARVAAGSSYSRRGGRPLAGRLSTAMHSSVACAGAATATTTQEGEGEG